MELATRTLTRIPLAAAFAAALLAAAPAHAGYRVVLADGRNVEASTRPVLALGRVNFHDSQGRAVSLASSAVDVEATRRELRRELGHAAPTRWTAESLASTDARLQVLGSSEPAASGEEPEVRSERAAEGSLAGQRALLEHRIERLQDERRRVSADSPEGKLLDRRYYLLQGELLRLRSQPSDRVQLASR